MMSRVQHLVSTTAAVILLVGTAVAQDEAPKFKYVGINGCASCHKRASKGNQLGKWQESAHSKAYATLAGDKAKEIAAARKIADPQKAPECLSCHVTGYPVSEDQIAPGRRGKTSYDMSEGVTCEACHGPGSKYRARKLMKNREAATAAGLKMPDEATCTTCHNEKSPTYTGFDFKEYAAKIAHPDPKLHPEKEE